MLSGRSIFKRHVRATATAQRSCSCPCGFRRKRTPGITQVELLVVIALIAILSVLLFPVFSTVRKKSDSIQCVTNLRNIGQAIMFYAVDNGQRLPGPVYHGQAISYIDDGGDRRHFLVYHLAPYLGVDTDNIPLNTPVRMDAFVCPAWRRMVPVSEDDPAYKRSSYYRVAHRINLPDEELLKNPFGNHRGSETNPLTPPVLLAAIPGKLSEVWAVSDTDASFLPTSYPSSQPVHGSIRNRLYFDGSVCPDPVDPSNPSYDSNNP